MYRGQGGWRCWRRHCCLPTVWVPTRHPSLPSNPTWFLTLHLIPLQPSVPPRRWPNIVPYLPKVHWKYCRDYDLRLTAQGHIALPNNTTASYHHTTPLVCCTPNTGASRHRGSAGMAGGVHIYKAREVRVCTSCTKVSTRLNRAKQITGSQE